ncbi:CoA transferase [Phreatobacter stygius]|uniref:CoA transferase n=1 Tax=Phreatobacter stygius TaxID=1940610 RepID=A0A4D7BHS1_9HYPH|nr:CoA transferase [Phreatobacter stygius]QCI67367.1 hypothetical protein E8M01_25965 [Phreatobacter stygius]
MTAPLAGLTVLDLGALCAQPPHALAVSMAAKLCAGFGAIVVRPVPEAGEPFATMPPLLPAGGSALDRFLNADKRAGGTDGCFAAVIGDTTALSRHAAGIAVKVRVSVFGPGEDPPMSELGLQALSGLLDIVGQGAGIPTRLPGHQAAYAAGLAACTGLLAALKAGGAEIVDVSLFDVSAWLNWKVAARVAVLGETGRPGPSDWLTLPARDGHIALVYQDKDWPALCAMIGDPRLLGDDLTTAAGRRAGRDRVTAILGPWFAARTRAEIGAAAEARRLPIGPVLWPAELLHDRQHQARGFLAADGTPLMPLRADGQRIAREFDHAA